MTSDRSPAGLKSHVVSDEEAEKASLVVCCTRGTPSPFTDNVEALCSCCGVVIFHRPHVPKTPPKICLQCAIAISGATRQ